MRDQHPALSFSSGIIGWPPGCTALPHPLAAARTRPHFYSTEQGFLAANYLAWPGPHHLVPWSSVPAVNDHNKWATPTRVLASCDGAHFSDHNVGRSTRFATEFAHRLYIPTRGQAPRRELTPVHLIPGQLPCNAS
jgi:hypothetical protein